MCGIAGYYSKSYSDHTSQIKLMLKPIHSRGPDDSGVWLENGLVLGHQRLSIQDLSPAGHQPMISRCGRYVIVYNGEIYNYLEMKECLDHQGINWRGHSDTEVLLEYINQFGIGKLLADSRGMFAFALYDRLDKKLTLARDQMGIKPLYYGMSDYKFFFSSEIKSFNSGFDHGYSNGLELNLDALSCYFKFSYITGEKTIYQGIYRLGSGQMLEVDLGKDAISWEVITYWKNTNNTFPTIATNSFKDNVECLDVALNKSVLMQMRSDVPYGAFLSGGVDSSLIAALMVNNTSNIVKTFALGFGDERYDELGYAKEISKYLGTQHTEYIVTYDDAINVIPELPKMYDEPFADSSQIPTFLVSKLARNEVKVCLSGDGADELFGGYEKYLSYYKLLMMIERQPIIARRILSTLLRKAPDCSYVIRLLSRFTRFNNIDDKVSKLSMMLVANPFEGYLILDSFWHDTEHLITSKTGRLNASELLDKDTFDYGLQQFMMLHDQRHYLPNDILVKLDRATMHTSLEARVPFLDYHIVEFANSLPLSQKIHNGNSKHILKTVLSKYVPLELFDRPKMGFKLPIDGWLRYELRDWAEAYLDCQVLSSLGFINVDMVRRKWALHLSGAGEYGYWLWSVLMFVSWMDSQKR